MILVPRHASEIVMHVLHIVRGRVPQGEMRKTTKDDRDGIVQLGVGQVLRDAHARALAEGVQMLLEPMTLGGAVRRPAVGDERRWGREDCRREGDEEIGHPDCCLRAVGREVCVSGLGDSKWGGGRRRRVGWG
jgi:hypothetical protein